MRIIVFGAGAVGSVIGGRLHQGGSDVVLVARPAHADAIRAGGLRLRTAEGIDTVDVPVATELRDLTPRRDDVVLITAKTQDTPTIHDALLAWSPDTAVVCGTNGVEHERMALRRFANVYGMCIQLPAEFETPGEVTALCLPTNAVLDVGRYPCGVDPIAEELAGLIAGSPHLSSEPDDDIMVKKYAKMLVNLGNTADAACGFAARRGSPLVAEAIDEAKRAYEAAGIAWRSNAAADESQKRRMATMSFSIPEGDTFLGGSTWQSIAKGAASVETDYFNGEIVLLGRQHGVLTPVNEFFQDFANRMVHERIPAGSMTVEELEAEYRRWSAAPA